MDTRDIFKTVRPQARFTMSEAMRMTHDGRRGGGGLTQSGVLDRDVYEVLHRLIDRCRSENIMPVEFNIDQNSYTGEKHVEIVGFRAHDPQVRELSRGMNGIDPLRRVTRQPEIWFNDGSDFSGTFEPEKEKKISKKDKDKVKKLMKFEGFNEQ